MQLVSSSTQVPQAFYGLPFSSDGTQLAVSGGEDALPEWCDDVDDLHSMLINELKVDDFFTDFPDLARTAIDNQ